MENHVQMLQEQCLRHLKIMLLPASEREKYASGITKLEIQIEQLRDACEMNTAAFCTYAQKALYADQGVDVWTDETVEHAGAFLDEAGKCYNIGDKAGMHACFMKLRLYVGGLIDAKANGCATA
jgi:hypothetical protein